MKPTKLLSDHIWPTVEMAAIAKDVLTLLKSDYGPNVSVEITKYVPDNRTLGEFARALSAPALPPNETVPAYHIDIVEVPVKVRLRGRVVQ